MRSWIKYVLLFIILAAAGVWLRQVKFEEKTVLKSSSINTSTHSASILNKEFYTGFLNPPEYLPVNKKVYGGIVSHHFFAEREITEFFLKLKDQKVSTIVLVGPNHFSWGSYSMLTSEQSYKTPWGLLEPNLEIIEKLKQSGQIFVEEKPFETEHSISALAGFIKKVFPEVKLVPVIIMRNVSQEKSKQLAAKLNEILPEDTLILASVDFSHHFDLKTTEANDKLSLEALKNFDYNLVYKSQMDSPQSIVVLLEYLAQKQAKNFEYINTNSAVLGKNYESKDITSYVFGIFTKE